MAPEMFLYNGSGSIPPILTNDSIVGDVFASVDSVVAGKPAGLLPLFPGEAIGDPASARALNTRLFHLIIGCPVQVLELLW